MTDDLRRRTLAFAGLAAVCAVLTAVGIVALDRPIAEWALGQAEGDTIWSRGTDVLDVAFLKHISNFVLGPIVLVVGAILLARQRTRALGWIVTYVGAAQLTATMVADFSKPPIGRLRPFQALANPELTELWFVGGNSFPSGHVAFTAGLFLPLMMIKPRWSVAFAIPPLFMAGARVVSTNHYLSDVMASLAIASLATAAFAFMLARASR